jgi:hypothetical protein
VVLVARGLDMEAQRVAQHLEWPVEKVESALAYAAAYPQEVDPIVDDVETMTYERLKQRIPWLKLAKL